MTICSTAVGSHHPSTVSWWADDRDALGAGKRREQTFDGRADRCADIYEPRPQHRPPGALQLGHRFNQVLQPLDLGANDAQAGVIGSTDKREA